MGFAVAGAAPVAAGRWAEVLARPPPETGPKLVASSSAAVQSQGAMPCWPFGSASAVMREVTSYLANPPAELQAAGPASA